MRIVSETRGSNTAGLLSRWRPRHRMETKGPGCLQRTLLFMHGMCEHLDVQSFRPAMSKKPDKLFPLKSLGHLASTIAKTTSWAEIFFHRLSFICKQLKNGTTYCNSWNSRTLFFLLAMVVYLPRIVKMVTRHARTPEGASERCFVVIRKWIVVSQLPTERCIATPIHAEGASAPGSESGCPFEYGFCRWDEQAWRLLVSFSWTWTKQLKTLANARYRKWLTFCHIWILHC